MNLALALLNAKSNPMLLNDRVAMGAATLANYLLTPVGKNVKSSSVADKLRDALYRCLDQEG